jgi:hypothetical protein
LSPLREGWSRFTFQSDPHPHTTNLDPVVEDFEGLWLRTLKDRTSEGKWLLDFNYEKLGHQLHTYLSPRPTQEDLRRVLFSLTNAKAQLSRGE